MKRGDVVVASFQGDYGKPRPAVVVQSDLHRTFDSVVVVLLTTDLDEALKLRPILTPTVKNGLHSRSQVMVDKPYALKRSKVGAVIGELDSTEMEFVTRQLALLLGIGD
jgi:mRNA interferase MazF